jgi:hypothetical protein
MYNSEILVWNDCLLVTLEWLQEVYLSSSPVLILKHEIKNAKNYSMKLKIIARNFYAKRLRRISEDSQTNSASNQILVQDPRPPHTATTIRPYYHMQHEHKSTNRPTDQPTIERINQYCVLHTT